jgi:hypothetical protein
MEALSAELNGTAQPTEPAESEPGVPEQDTNDQEALGRDSVGASLPQPVIHHAASSDSTVVAVKAGAATSASLPHRSAGSRTAQSEFDHIIHDLCANASQMQDGTGRLASRLAQRTATQVIARYQELRLMLTVPENVEYWPAARDGLAALKAGNSVLAEAIRSKLAYRISRSASLSRVILGIIAYLLLAVIITSAFLSINPLQSLTHPEMVFKAIRQFVDKPSALDASFAAAVFGGLGSVVSLLLRIGSFESVRGRSGLYLFMFGLVQPIIGLIIGGVVGTALAAHMINVSFQHVDDNAAVNVYFVAVVGFLCGFSERVAKTALATAGRAAGLQDEQSAVGGATATVTIPAIRK